MAKKYKPRKGRRGMRSNGSSVLAPGAAAVTKKAFGAGSGAKHYSLACWDAKMPLHLPLPRAVGPYTVIRITRRFNNNARVSIFGTFKTGDSSDWASTCCMRDVSSGGAMNLANNAYFYANPMGGIGAAATVVPSAFSVQVMNPNPLQTTAGVVYAGVLNTQAAVANREETWVSYGNKFVEFQAPRILTAPKLALRGVQINSYPLNMAALANFRPVDGLNVNEGTTTWNSAAFEPYGFAPIIVYNATSDVPPDLEYLVTTEYRVRFDLDNVASASHRHHPIASDSVWNDLMKRATSLGNGVIDIVEGVADMGETAARGIRAGSRLRALASVARPLALA